MYKHHQTIKSKSMLFDRLLIESFLLRNKQLTSLVQLFLTCGLIINGKEET